MSRKKLLKLGISILALNALGVATYHVAPDLYEIKTVHAEEPGEDEEIPDAQERSIAFKFRDKMNDLEEDFNDFKKNPSDEETRELVQDELDDVVKYYGIAKKAMKSEVGKKFFAPLEERYHTLKAKVEAALNGKTEEPTTPKVEHQEITTTEEIPYASRTETNADLAEGTRNVKQAGVKGIKTITWDITLTDGKETARTKKSEKVTKEPVEEIIEVGTKKVVVPVVTTKEETKTEEVAFQTKEVTNSELPEGSRQVKTAGKKGVRTIVETVTYTDGVETGRVEKSNTITTPAVDEVIEVGTKKVVVPVVTTKEETKTEEVVFQTKEVTNSELPEGSRRVKTAGKKGVRTIVYTVTYTDGVETGRVEKSNTIITPAVDEVIEVGTKKVVVPVVTTKEETKTEEVAFQTKEVTNPDLPEGSRQVKTAGQKGVRTIVETVTYTDGVETGRVEKSNTITTPAVDEVIEVGTKKVVVPVVTTKEETKTEEVAFQTKEVTNPDLPEGSRQVKAAGKKGVRTIVYTVTYTDGVETGRVEKSNTITIPAVDEIVEVGTKKVASTTTNGDKKDTATTGNQAENTKKEETASQDKKVLPSTGTASTSLLSIIGLAFASLAAFVLRKKD